MRVFRIRQALRTRAGLAAAATEARQFFTRDLVPHFRAEEEIVLPVVRQALGPEHRLFATLVEDHRVLVRLACDLDASPDRLSTFADLIERHVRFEERDLFQQYQEEVPAAVRPDVEARLRRILNRAGGAPRVCALPNDVTRPNHDGLCQKPD
jgi:hemerythrin-like domain-containing protein